MPISEHPLPESKAFADDERSVLLGHLADHRAVLARKLDGLTDEQARRAAIPPSRLTLLGLVRHMTDVERIEEYARHCGHADLLREVVDGTTGD